MAQIKKPCLCFVMRFESADIHAGAEIQAGNLAFELTRLGWNVHYVCRSMSGHKTVTERNGVVFHYVGHQRRLFVMVSNIVE